MRNKLILKTVILLSTLSLTLAGAKLLYTVTIPSSGNIHTIGLEIFWNSNLTNPVLSVPWGTLNPGDQALRSFYIYNNATVSETLSLKMENVNPSDFLTYASLSWNGESHLLNPQSSFYATLTLTILANATGTPFNFDIILTGLEA